MDPERLRKCMSLGYSSKTSNSTIGQCKHLEFQIIGLGVLICITGIICFCAPLVLGNHLYFCEVLRHFMLLDFFFLMNMLLDILKANFFFFGLFLEFRW